MPEPPRRTVVVGGGITGLAAAPELVWRAGSRCRTGGLGAAGRQAAAGEVAGVPVDLGAESMLNRRPEGVDLARALGLGDASSTRDDQRRGLVPRRDAPVAAHGDGRPGRPGAVADSRCSPPPDSRGARDAPAGCPRRRRVRRRAGRERLGGEVVDRLVEPLLGGVYAGHARRSPSRDGAAARRSGARAASLLAAAAQAGVAPRAGPVFAGIRGGVGPAAGRGGARRRRSRTVRAASAVSAHPSGWRLVVGPTVSPRTSSTRTRSSWRPRRAGRAAAGRRRPGGGGRARRSSSTPRRDRHPRLRAPPSRRRLAGSGFLVPPVEGRPIKAATFSPAKWGWLAERAADGVRACCATRSAGTARSRDLQRDDADLVAAVARRPRRGHRPSRPAGRQPGEAVGRRAAAVRRRPPRRGSRRDPRGGRRRARPRGLPARRTTGSASPPCVALGAARRPRRRARRSAATMNRMSDAGTPAPPAARELNDAIRYTMWSVFRLRDAARRTADREPMPQEVEALFAELAEQGRRRPRHLRRRRPARRRRPHGLVARARRSTRCRRPTTASGVRRSGRRLEPVWSQLALHRPAEFNKSHVPAFLADEEPRGYVCVYPFVRSYEWYLLEERAARRCSSSTGRWRATTPTSAPTPSPSFALGDYEWMLAFEADELHRIVDLMRHLRGSQRAPARARGGAVLHRSPRPSPTWSGCCRERGTVGRATPVVPPCVA